MKALKRIHAAPAAVDRRGVHTPGVATRGVHTPGVATPGVATPGLAIENAKLRELVQHCAEHSASGNCGYDQMNAEQRSLYNGVVGRHVPAGAPRVAAVAVRSTPWRSCEFCGCRTNATERVCCRRGRDTDRHNWMPPGA
jgi:hypothetical protein